MMKKLLMLLLLALPCVAYGANDKVVRFKFYGNDVQIHFDTSKRVRVKSGTNGELVRCLEWLNNVTYETVEDCQQIKKDMNLSDWAYVQLLDRLAEASLGKTNEAVLMMAWMMDLSDYNVAICKAAKGGLRLLYVTDAELPDYKYREDKERHYYPYNDMSLTTFKSYDRLSTVGNPVSFRKYGDQKFAVSPTDLITVVSKQNPAFSFTFRFNQHMIDFFNSVPRYIYDGDDMQRWPIMAAIPLEQYLQGTLVQDMKQKVAGMKQQEAIQQIMWWVQTGFDQVDENEKNVILSRLVRDVLGLKVAFINYPGHTATAISITDEDVRGAYVVKNGRHYVICDAAYAGGKVGEELPSVAGLQKTLTLLDN